MELLTLLQNVPIAVAVVFVVYILGRAWLEIEKIKANTEKTKTDVQVKESESRVKATELEMTARIKAAELESQAKVKASELAAETAKILAVTEQQRGEREEKLTLAAQQTALLQAQQTAAIAAIVGGQKQTAATIAKSIRVVGDQVEGTKDDVLGAVAKLGALFATGFDLLVTDSKAFYDRSDRAMRALLEGDIAAAKDIAAEGTEAEAMDAAQMEVQR